MSERRAEARRLVSAVISATRASEGGADDAGVLMEFTTDLEDMLLETAETERRACRDRVLKEGVTSEVQARVIEDLIMSSGEA